MKTFEDELKRAIDNAPFTPGLDDGGYNDGFIDGLEHAQELIDKLKNEAINEILTKYMEWASNLPASQFDKWDKEEGGDYEKAQERIRREFVKFTNNVE